MIEKYIEALTAEQQKLISYVKRMTANVTFPESAVEMTEYIQPKNHKAVSVLCLVGGALAVIAGCYLDKSSVAVAGGIVVAGGAGLMVMDRNNSGNASVQREVDYSRATSHYYKSLSNIYKYATSHWTETLTELKGKIKADIMQMNIAEEKQNEAIQSILTTSVVDMSMSNLSKKLNEIESTKDENGYKQFVPVFERKCIEAINTAFDEQKAIYEKLHSLFNGAI